MSATPTGSVKRMQERDGYKCVACGTEYDLTPQHRANRGMGGSKRGHGLSNLVTMCRHHNEQLESDPKFAELGRRMGWKVKRNSGPPPSDIAVWSFPELAWFLLADDGSRLRLSTSPAANPWLPEELLEHASGEGPTTLVGP